MNNGYNGNFKDYLTIKELLKDICELHKDRIAFRYTLQEEITITYEKFWKDIVNTACSLLEIHPNDEHIGVICTNTYECIVFIYAIIVSGKVAVLVEKDIKSQELVQLMTDTDTKIIYGYSSYEYGSYKIYSFINCLSYQGKEDFINHRKHIEPQHPASILFTSGTTGERQGVVLSNRNMSVAIKAGKNSYLCKEGVRTILVLPLYHMFGIETLTCQIANGQEMCINMSTKYFQKDLQKYKPEGFICVPLILEYMYKKINLVIEKKGYTNKFNMLRKFSDFLRKNHIDLTAILFKSINMNFGGRLKLIICGGAFLDKEIIYFFESLGIKIYEGYGLTETATHVSTNTDACYRPGSVGVLAPYNEVRIRDGEVQIKGENIMLGYYNNTELTKKSFDDEWFKTGDLGYIDDDNFLYITGRKKNLIILSNGQNISPEELENELLKSNVIDEVVVKEKNGHIHAMIYSEQIHLLNRDELTLRIQDVIVKVNKSNSHHKLIGSYEILDEPFKKTTTMKIKR